MAKNQKQIDSEINDLATKMTKSTVDSRQMLFDTIMNLGPEGLKKAAANLSPQETELLKACLEEMKKSANMPEPTADAKKLSPEKTKTPAKKMETESLSGSDNQDEKLMETENAQHRQQGGPKDSPLEGQVIKGREMGQEHPGPHGGIIIGHTSTGKPMYANAEHPAHRDMDHKDHKEASKMHQGHADRIRSEMSMAERDEKGEVKDKPNHVEMYSQARLHEKHAMEHQKQAAKKEDAEMQKCYGSGMMKSMKKAVREVMKNGGDLKKAYENFMTKAENKAKRKLEKKQGVPEGVDPEKWERGVKEVKNKPGVDNPYAIVNAAMTKGEPMNNQDNSAPAMEEKRPMDGEDNKKKMSPEEKLEKKKMKKAKKVEKSLRKIVKMAKSLKMSKEEIVKAIKAANNNLKLVKAEMKAKLLKEEDQVKMGGQDKKEAGDVEQKINKDKGELEIKADQTADEAVNKVPKMEKSVNWNLKSSIAANSLGRNTHYDVDAYIEQEDAKTKETIKKGAYLGETQGEPLKKAEGQKADLNDLIEKGFDYSSEEIARLQGLQNHKTNGIEVRKSFHDVEIARSLGMSEEEYKKLFGE